MDMHGELTGEKSEAKRIPRLRPLQELEMEDIGHREHHLLPGRGVWLRTVTSSRSDGTMETTHPRVQMPMRYRAYCFVTF